ncbi:hypothetical protein PPTG_17797 [Phytophthora nicotianae INRA-310]|uniref:D-isomer specific 2-hydroxyacid dehydrogenase catalytic domain-containing protein n=1 Tax=Phytophthora nicotianae (strain INRA-310) TaxID=761204 RepID=W2PI79_PHYN3|nr:hypothetical protein PPTG_17797 [Phytophthora nicotianae INRA-310]ETN00572.1 hypothetical protein PPTG_17797 [Phytophthora nicotianae INRA-310]
MKVVCVLSEGGDAGKRNSNILDCVENELGLRKFLEDRSHESVVTSDKDGNDSEFARHLHDDDVVISQPFWPAYITRERVAKASKLKLAITAGIGSDQVDLVVACDRNITMTVVTGSNIVSVAEHVVMMILSLVRSYMPAYKQVVDCKYNIAAITNHAYDLENKHVGVVAAGRIGLRVQLHYTDKVAAGRRGERAERHVPRDGGEHGEGVRHGVHQLSAVLGDREPVRRAAAKQDEEGRVHRRHGAQQDRGQGRAGEGRQEQSHPGLLGRRVVPATCAGRLLSFSTSDSVAATDPSSNKIKELCLDCCI